MHALIVHHRIRRPWKVEVEEEQADLKLTVNVGILRRKVRYSKGKVGCNIPPGTGGGEAGSSTGAGGGGTGRDSGTGGAAAARSVHGL